MPTLPVAIDARKAAVGAAVFNTASSSITANASKMGVALAAFGASLFVFSKLSRAVGGAVRDFAKFQQGMAQVSTMLTKQTMHLLPKMSEAVRELSVQYGESTTTLSKGLYDILSASIDASKALDVLEVSAMAAKGGMTSTGTAADALTTILNSYGMEADQALKVSDILFATVAGGKTTFDELAQSVGMVSALSATAGLSFEEVGASLATMTRAGLSTSMAVTALKAVVTNFLSPQKQSIEVAKKFGVVLNANTLKTEGLAGVLVKLKDARAEDVSAIFGNIRALTGMATLLQQVEGYQNDLNNTTNASGRSQAAFDKNTSTLSQTMEEYKASLKDVRVELGSILAPAAAAAIALGHDMNKGLTETLKTTQSGFPGMKSLVASLEEIRQLNAAKQFEQHAKAMEDAGFASSSMVDYYRKQAAESRVLAEASREMILELNVVETTFEGTSKAANKSTKELDNIVGGAIRLMEGLEPLTDKTKDFNDELQRLKDIEALQVSDPYDSIAAQKELDNERLAIERLLKSIKNLKLQQSLVGKTPEQQGLIRRQAALGSMVGDVEQDTPEIRALASEYQSLSIDLAETSAEYRKMLEAKREATKETKKEAKQLSTRDSTLSSLKQQIQSIRNESQFLDERSDKRERAIALTNFHKQAVEGLTDSKNKGIDADIQALEAAEELTEAYGKELDVMRRQEKAYSAGVEAGNLFGNSLVSIGEHARNTEEALDALNDMLIEVIRVAIKYVFVQKMGESIGGMVSGMFGPKTKATPGADALPANSNLSFGGQSITNSAKGNVFSNGQVSYFGKGGLTSGVTAFALGGAGGLGIMGEAGTEGVFPLGRNSKGELGVKSTGGSGQQPVIIQNQAPQIIIENNTGSEIEASPPTSNGTAFIVKLAAKNMREGGELYKAWQQRQSVSRR